MHLAIITGASSGIGAALVDTARNDDARVATLSRRPADGDDHLSCDLADPSTWPRLRDWVTGLVTPAVTRLTVVHAAAVVGPIGFIGEVDGNDVGTGAILDAAVPQVVGQAVLARLDALRTAGHDLPATIMMVTSGAATSAYLGLATYCAGKAAMDHWVRVVGAEQEARKTATRVWAVAPGVVASDMQVDLRAADEEDFPNTTRHRALADDDALSTPTEAARGLWDLAMARAHPNGAILDLRTVSTADQD